MAGTVLIVDDHASFRRSARTLLELEGYEVVGEAADGASAQELVDRLRPGLVLLDIALPDTSGFRRRRAAGGRRREGRPDLEPGARDFGRRVSRSGAIGFVPKDRLSGPALAALLDKR